ncbi:MAG: transketolase [Melioribacteraceae bacterium]|nr:MAG: transketolase [Melioribacteraceae bacterium]
MNYEELLEKLVNEDDRYVVMTAENRAAIRNLPPKIAKNFIDTGITEATMIGMAAGLASRGRIPITHALATFLTMRAFEFVRTDVGISGAPVKLVGAVPGFLSEANGPTHQAIEDVSIMRGIPPMNVFCPADIDDMMLGLDTVFADENPWYIRFNNLKSVVEHEPFEIGKAEVFGSGTDVAILTYGTLFNEALEAVRILEESEFSIRLINMRSLKPVDEEAILSAAEECEMIVTLEDHFLTGGLYSILSEVLVKNRIAANVLPFALENKWFKPALLKDVLDYEGFTGAKIAKKIISKF